MTSFREAVNDFVTKYDEGEGFMKDKTREVIYEWPLQIGIDRRTQEFFKAITKCQASRCPSAI